MPISIEHDIGPMLDLELPKLIDKFPAHQQIIESLCAEFKRQFGERVIRQLQEGTFCETVEAWVESKLLPSELVVAIHELRLRVFRNMMLAKRFAFELPSNGEDQSVSSYPRPGNGEKRKRRNETEITQIVMEYAQLAVYLGDAVALDVLQMMGVLDAGERATGLSCIARYLGECEGRGPRDEDEITIDILGMPEDILKNMTVFDKMHRSLIEHCYRKLLLDNADDLEHQTEVLRTMEKRTRTMLDALYTRAFDRQGKTVSRSHLDLYESVVLHFKTAASLKIPSHMAQTAFDHNGKEWPLGSLRQRLALTDVMDPEKRHAYVGFDAGKGKTFTHLWAYELTKRERESRGEKGRTRMLFMGPKAVIGEIPNRVREGSGTKPTSSRYYPDPATAPTVGVIREKMSSDKIRAAASCDIVFCAYSMWRVEKKEKKKGKKGVVIPGVSVEEVLLRQDEPFTNLSFDEAHLLQGDRDYTAFARRAIREIPDLFSKGHVVASSATPAPGHLAGLRVTLELLEEPQQTTEHGERRVAKLNHWAKLRRMIGKLWMMDEREEWMQHVERHAYDLQPAERECLGWIIDDSTMPPLQKLNLSQLAIRCPRLLSGDKNMPWSSFEQTTKHLNDLLFQEDRSTVLVAENMLANKVLRAPDQKSEDGLTNPEDFFFTALGEWCKNQGVEFHIIHGNIEEDERIAIYEAMKLAKDQGRKSVLYAQSKCLNLGIDLRFIQGIISQQWPYNTPDLYQLLKRALRMGNTDCRVIALYARETVEEGILSGAELKYADVMQCIHGVPVSDKRLEELSEKKESNLEDASIRKHIESTEQKWKRFTKALHGAGRSGVQGFWQKHQNDFLEILEQKDRSSIGDGDRALAGLVLDLEKNRLLSPDSKYLHTGSMGLGVTRLLQIADPDRPRSVRGMDPTQEMLDYGWINLPIETDNTQNIVGTPKDLQKLVREGTIPVGSQDLVILGGFEQTGHALHAGELQSTGRVRALKGASKALKSPTAPDGIGGILVLPLSIDACSEEELKSLRDQLAAFGFEIIDSYTGVAASKDNADEPESQMHVITARKAFEYDNEDLRKVKPESLVLTQLQGRAAKRKQKKRKLPYELPHEEFKIGRKPLVQVAAPGRDEKLRYLQRLNETVSNIHAIASSPQEFLSKFKSAGVKSKLDSLEVACFPHLSGAQSQDGKRKKEADASEQSLQRRLAFRFTDSVHLFYPYDQQWRGADDSK